jgi:hypothetical protein
MVQLGNRLGLAPESLHGIPVSYAGKTEDLQGHFAVERYLPGFIDHAHAAAADLAHDFEVAQSGWGIRHWAGRTMNELNAGKARFQLGGQARMFGKQLFARGGPSCLQIGQILIQYADQFLARGSAGVGGRDIGRRGGSF